MKNKIFTNLLKRISDLTIILISLLILIPVLIIIFFLVKAKLGSPVFFKQTRPGLNGKKFNIYKFRTMTNEFDKNGFLLQDKDRLTEFGKFLNCYPFYWLMKIINKPKKVCKF